MYYLGVDVGSTKTHALIIDENGKPLGFACAGPGNPENVGDHGFLESVRSAIVGVLSRSGVPSAQLGGAGFGISGYDWPCERAAFLDLLDRLKLPFPVEIVNDTCLGLLAGSDQGWGVAVVSGTGCNCWGWTEHRQKIAHVTGNGWITGEGAGSTDLVMQAVKMVSYEWTTRGPSTALTQELMKLTGAASLEDLVEGLCVERYRVDGSAAPLIFEVAGSGDPVAREIVLWAGRELGELAKCVIRRLNLEKCEFDLVMIGSMFDGGSMLIQPMKEAILSLAPSARMVRLNAPPVVGAALLGMEAAGGSHTAGVRRTLLKEISHHLNQI